MATTNLSLKLLIDKKSNKVLFGEANKEFIDFLFSLMSTPVGSVIRLLSKEKMVGCLGDLYDSIEKLSDTYVQPNQTKDSILKTKSSYFVATSLRISDYNDRPTLQNHYYTCGCTIDYHDNDHWTIDYPDNDHWTIDYPDNDHNSYGRCRHDYVTNTIGTKCPSCGCQMKKQLVFAGSTGTGTNNTAASTSTAVGGVAGFVKGVVTYMVMDNLVVMPMSTISSITLLNKFNVQDVGALEEKEVYLGMEEGLSMLEASLQSKMVLTDVFLKNKVK